MPSFATARAATSVRGVVVGILLVFCACTEVVALSPTDIEPALAARELADRYCGGFDRCQCDREHGRIDACRNLPDLEDRIADAQAAGATWDGECMAELLDGLADGDCLGAPVGASFARCPRPCRPLHGNLEVGEPCERDGDFSMCAQTLECLGGLCVDPCASLEWGNEPDSCARFSCPDGFACRPEGCVDLASDGDACTGHRRCKSDYCPAGFCEARPAAGESCALSLCAADHACLDGVCKASGQQSACAPPCSADALCFMGECLERTPLVCTVGLSLPE